MSTSGENRPASGLHGDACHENSDKLNMRRLPPSLRRDAKLCIVGLILPGLGMYLANGLVFASSRAVGATAIVLLTLSPFLLFALRHWRIVAVRRRHYRVCVQCEYSLENLPQIGRCPECGTEYNLARAGEAWEAFLPY